jgi:hypothetical protein
MSWLCYIIGMTEHTKIDLRQLVKEIRAMNSRKKIYQIVKQELTAQRHWKNRGRGDSAKGFKVMQERKNHETA